MRIGGIYHHLAFYADPRTGELLAKYLLILALPAGGDVVHRVLTSRYPDLRPEGCHHGPPYPGFYLGVPGGELSRRTWIDLRKQVDYDIDLFRGRLAKGAVRFVMRLDSAQLREALACAASADDTLTHQARHIRNAMAGLDGV